MLRRAPSFDRLGWTLVPSIAITVGVGCERPRISPQPPASARPTGDRASPTSVGSREIAVEGRFGGIALGDEHACAWTREGTAVCWGNNRRGELGITPRTGWCRPIRSTAVTEVRQLVARAHHTCAVDARGVVTCWGPDPSRPRGDPEVSPHVVPLPVPVRAVATADDGACAIGQDGRVWCWSARWSRMLGWLEGPTTTPVVLPDLEDVQALAVSDAVGCAVAAEGVVRCWGATEALLTEPAAMVTGRLGGPATLRGASARPAIAMVGDIPCVAGSDGRVVCWADEVPGWSRGAPQPRATGIHDAVQVFGSGLPGVGCALRQPAPSSRTTSSQTDPSRTDSSRTTSSRTDSSQTTSSRTDARDAHCRRGLVACFTVDGGRPRAEAPEPPWREPPASPYLRVDDEIRSLALTHARAYEREDMLGCHLDAHDQLVCWRHDGSLVEPDALAAVERGQWAEDAAAACRGIDSDGDGPPDEVDQCPDDPEVYNGTSDGDGCPDDGVSLVEVDELQGVVRLRRKVTFVPNKDVLTPESFEPLRHLAAVLAGYSRWSRIEIQGHRDATGRDAYGRKPTQRRAEAVRDFLVQQGIDPARLVAVGYGEERPIDTNRTAQGRANNRRIEIHILDFTD